MRTVTDTHEALRLWAECEQGPVEMPQPGGRNPASEATGIGEAESAWLYVTGTPGYRFAYPALWWVWLHGGQIERFRAAEYFQLCKRQRAASELTARAELGYLDRPAVMVLGLFACRLESRLLAEPLEILGLVPPQAGIEAASLAIAQMEIARSRKWVGGLKTWER